LDCTAKPVGYLQRYGVPCYYFYPQPGKSHLEAMKRVIDMCLDGDKVNADGVYWDELEMTAAGCWVKSALPRPCRVYLPSATPTR
jgi:hypothetical protein